MPPKIKFKREEIIKAAFEMTRKNGFGSVTARSLGEKLGVSSRPVFTAFENMEELRNEVIKSARELYNNYIKNGLSENPKFKGVGTAYIKFAKEEPILFRLLFMSEIKERNIISEILPEIDENYDEILLSITDYYGLERHDAEKVYRHLWLYTHGIASLSATETCVFSDKEINIMLTEVFTALLKEIKGREKNND